jgi:hypothetical protein
MFSLGFLVAHAAIDSVVKFQQDMHMGGFEVMQARLE